MRILIVLLSSLLLVSSAAPADLQSFVVQVRPPPPTAPAAAAESVSADDLEKWYRSFLPKSLSNTTSPQMLHMYTEAITGFAARLSPSQVDEMSRKPGFIKAHPDRTLPLLTTHSPAFLGLHEGNGFWTGSRYGRGVIVGVLDSGIYPDHPSFSPDGMPPPPSKWKGGCDANFTGCNNKLIGARSIAKTSSTPLDTVGHGTHTASTAAGKFVEGATVLGNANGTAAGMAPYAHIAVYKVCGDSCNGSDILAGIDQAIKDGVDVMSLSLGGLTPDFYDDVIAIGGFSAAKKGVFVSCAAGNNGPSESSVLNQAPWLLNVGASTMDRNIRATVKLGDGQEFHGESAFQPKTSSSAAAAAIVYPKDGDCYSTSGLKDADVKGKVVLCKHIPGPRIPIGDQVKKAGGAAMVLMNTVDDGYTTVADVHSLPASHVSYADGTKILTYIRSSTMPTASILFEGTITGMSISPAPTVAAFSSRGPSKLIPGILRPDVIGPGVSVLAAWPHPVGPPSMSKKGQAPFNMISGTSMSTPHLSGIAALVKGEHPDWSPAAIKSAIMTTSDVVSQDGKPVMDEQHMPASFFQMGAGHVNPTRAADPGLVYDIDADDYISFLCGRGYTDDQMEVVVRKEVKCKKVKKMREVELNYPSISLGLGFQEAEVKRTVTNVGEATETYTAKVEMRAEGVEVAVSPETMEFTEVNEKKTFTVKISWNKSTDQMNTVEGNLMWISEKHVVRSPIVIS